MEENNKQLNDDREIKTIHTYEGDMANLVRSGQGSVVKIALAEQEKRRAEGNDENPKKVKSKNLIFILGGLIIIVAGIWLTFFLIKKANDQSMAQIADSKIQTFVPYDDQSTLDVTNVLNKDEFAKILEPELKSEIKAGNIKAVFLNINGALSNAQDFLKLINANMPGGLSRSLTDKYMVGVFSPISNNSVIASERKNHLFIILQTKDYTQAFAGMLEWEKTMLNDMFLLFSINVSGENQKLFETSFQDIIISNKDARVLRDQYGTDILYYLFLDNNTFVITDDQSTVKEVISRIITQNIKPL